MKQKAQLRRGSMRDPPKTTYCQKLVFPGYIFVADSMGLAAVKLMQLAPKATILCQITRNDGHWAIQVASDFGTDPKSVCDFLLLNNTHLCPIFQCVQVTAVYWSNHCF